MGGYHVKLFMTLGPKLMWEGAQGRICANFIVFRLHVVIKQAEIFIIDERSS